MARLHQSNGGRFTIKIPRGAGFSEHSLNTAGAERLKKAGVKVNGLVPFFQLQLLDQHREISPLMGAFKGQLQFLGAGYLKITRPPDKPRRRDQPDLRVIAVDWEQLTFNWRMSLERAA